MQRLIRHSGWTFFLVLAGAVSASADAPLDLSLTHGDFLQPADSQEKSAADGSFSAASGMDLSDPFAVISSNSLWEDRQSVTYSRAVMDHLTFDCSSSSVSEDGTPDQLGSDLRAETVYQPTSGLKVTGNVHSDSNTTPVVTNGAGCAVEAHLPLDTTFTAAIDNDQARADDNPGFDYSTSAYDASVQKPIGKLPVSLVLKGHLTETSTPGVGATRLPSFEQSLVWKAGDATTLQAGLRQQQYQNFPGLDPEFNEALFADWSQKILDDKLAWHSYAEMTNTRSTVETAEPAPGAAPQGGTTVGSLVPVSTVDQKVTFSTGPSVQLQKDISASLQYSSSWDQNPVPGSVSDEQRVSLSLKGTF
jgi:hypothetical protein